MTTTISRVVPRDVRFRLGAGQGTDSIHNTEEWAYATAVLESSTGQGGTGFALTMGLGNELVCTAIEALGAVLVGRDIDELMADFGSVFHGIADHPAYRWLGPHKGVVHLALGALTNACFDLWARSRGVPLWRLLLDLSPDEVVALLDLSYLDEVLSRDEAVEMLASQVPSRPQRSDVIELGYPGYDTSVGWFEYSDGQVLEKAHAAIGDGFGAVKLKVGAPDSRRDIARALKLREALGPDIRIMLDANQQWSLPKALLVCERLAEMSPYWIEEPTHPDDVFAHQTLARAIAPIRLAAGEIDAQPRRLQELPASRCDPLRAA